MQLRGHIALDGSLHVVGAHVVAHRAQRTEKRRVGNRPAKNLLRDAIRIDGNDAWIAERAHRVHDDFPIRKQLVLPTFAKQRIVEVDNVVRPAHCTAVANRLARHLSERAHRGATAFGTERGERQRIGSIGKRGRRAQKPCRCEGPLPAATVPKHFDHVKLAFLLVCEMSISIGEPGRAYVVSTIQYGQGRIEVGIGDFILMPRLL